MRALLGVRRPTLASYKRVAHTLFGLALWHYAVKAHQTGQPSLLKAGDGGKSADEVPAYALRSGGERSGAHGLARQVDGAACRISGSAAPPRSSAWTWKGPTFAGA